MSETVQRLSLLISFGRYSVVQAHGLLAIRLGSAALETLPEASRPPLIACLDRVPSGPRGLARWREGRRLRVLLGSCAAVLVPSVAEQAALSEWIGPDATEAQVMPPIIAARRPPSSAEAGFLRHGLGLNGHAAIVGLSTAFEEETPEVFLRAGREVLEDLGNVEFLILGEGPRREAYQDRAHELGLGGATVFMTQPGNLAEIISVLNVLVVLGEGGGLQTDALQALQFEVPLITAPLGGLREILPLFPSAQILEEATAELLAGNLRTALHFAPGASLGEIWESPRPVPPNSPEQVLALQAYSAEAVVKRLLQLYRRLLPA